MKRSMTLLLVAACLDVHASSCSMRSAEDIATNARIAFLGTVSRIEESSYEPWGACWKRSEHKPECGGKRVTFQVGEKLRGEYGATVTVVSEDACYCTGPYWNVNSSYLVVARKNTSDSPGQFAAENLCGGTGPVGDRAAVIEALRRSRATVD